MLKRYVAFLVLMGAMVIFSSCGGNYDAPEGSTITINPSDVSISDGRTGLTEAEMLATQHFQIVVKDSNGIPLKNVTIHISYVWAAPNADAVAQLYDGDEAKDSPMEATTDENGVYNLRFDFLSGNGLEYSADLQVSAGNVMGTAEFAVASGSE